MVLGRHLIKRASPSTGWPTLVSQEGQFTSTRLQGPDCHTSLALRAVHHQNFIVFLNHGRGYELDTAQMALAEGKGLEVLLAEVPQEDGGWRGQEHR